MRRPRPIAAATVARIAVITDAHANLPALDTALRAIDRLGADEVYHTGDVIGIGPFPAECLDRLLSRPATHLLMGNHDAWFAFGLPDESASGMPREERDHQQWVHRQLDPALKAAVATWPYASSLRVEGVRLDFLHYPLGPTEGFRAPIDISSAESADALFGLRASTLVFFGHDHRAWNVHGSTTRYVNPGALGCSAEPVARFALVEVKQGGAYSLTLHAEPYDPAPLFEALESRRVPAREFIRRNFLPAEAGPSIA
ncbi:MAG TPA: metallophosphoesterase family protein [Gemmatimonadaceae bacterium]|jgi:predicted phosphodiesterase|nr:metallophosphoesterase family protein [Gemmatimonadaceae bacterium]